VATLVTRDAPCRPRSVRPLHDLFGVAKILTLHTAVLVIEPLVPVKWAVVSRRSLWWVVAVVW
jgi:hypothetical protein